MSILYFNEDYIYIPLPSRCELKSVVGELSVHIDIIREISAIKCNARKR